MLNRKLGIFTLATVAASLGLMAPSGPAAAQTCAREITANIVALDQPLMFNRLGAQNVNGMVYALRRDVVSTTAPHLPLTMGGAATPGMVELRPDKRPRPLALRMAVGDCLTVNFQNLLDPMDNPFDEGHMNLLGVEFAGGPPPSPLFIDDQVVDRMAGFHPQGLELVDPGTGNGIDSDSSFVGTNASSLVGSGGMATYKFFARAEGTFLAVSYGATIGSEGSGGNTANGLFGVVNVQPSSNAGDTRFYRSQVTEEELRLALDTSQDLGEMECGMGNDPAAGRTCDGHPIVDYDALYPNVEPWISEGKAGLPIIDMLTATDELVHSDINAIIAGPNPDGTFDPNTYPLESMGKRNPTVPTRLEAFREFTVVFHDENTTAQAFPLWYLDPVLGHTLHGVRDSFMINYGSGGIGSEIIANRLGVGPMYDCLDCAYEEFFLAASTVGDPALLVDTPANVGLENCAPGAGGNIPQDLSTCDLANFGGQKAALAFYPDDPSNVHHSYTGDFVKFRNVHAGPKEQHIFHLHNHQWLFDPNDDNSNYIDAQGLGPGSGYTYEINFGGSGNRNKTVGDAIFHCHFYPHFAQGMWELWRVHDTAETGTLLEVSVPLDATNVFGDDGNADGYHDTPFALANGSPAVVGTYQGRDVRARSTADGEIIVGTPIPAMVPLPGKAMAPMPGAAYTVAKDTDGDGIFDSSQGWVADRTKNPGYPFWIAGYDCGTNVADCPLGAVGQRSTTPPLDMTGNKQDPMIAGADGGWDGGLPRHLLDGIKGGGAAISQQNRLDFAKVLTKAKPIYYPEEGTDLEQIAMAFHEERCHDSYYPDGSAADCDNMDLNDSGQPFKGGFITNGAPRVPGAPFAGPCIDDEGDLLMSGNLGDFFSGLPDTMKPRGPVEFGSDAPRVYKGANIQIDAVLNKTGYHFPQQRIITLWEDVDPTIAGTRPPEPFVIRLNTLDCADYLHTNLVPEVYELDDYQVRTPTDIIGQHIHLPKWDLVAADGSGNGWNYEDGTLSPGMVRERIEAINHYNDDPMLPDVLGPGPDRLFGTPDDVALLTPEAHPFFGAGDGGEWLGARTTIQRWFADPVLNVDDDDRGLGIIFTHDHYGPSTHQQVGLYATVLIEPQGSRWAHNETGEPMYTRPDGGPTSWQAVILEDFVDGEPTKGNREFYFEFADFQHAYQPEQPGVFSHTEPPIDVAELASQLMPDANSFRDAINPSVKVELDTIYPDVFRYDAVCPGGVMRPCPEAISADDPGILVVNYRAEPVGLRVYDPAKLGPDGKSGSQADGLAGDLAYAMKSDVTRAIAALNMPWGNTPYPPLTQDQSAGDPFTPMMRVHHNDKVEIKMQSGAHEEEHNVSVHGVNWLQGGSGFGDALNSGWRNSQAAGISEQFTFTVPMLFDVGAKKAGGPQGSQAPPNSDHFYTTHSGMDGYWSGVWGLMRAYSQNRSDLFRLPNNPNPKPGRITNSDRFAGVCPATPETWGERLRDRVPANLRSFEVLAIAAQDVLPPGPAWDDTADYAVNTHVGETPDPTKGTLVYNSRATSVDIVDDLGNVVATKAGPLHDPTALLYVNVADLEPVDPFLAACGGSPGKGKNGTPVAGNDVLNPNCPVQLKAPLTPEPLILRAAAGDCVEVTLYNRVPEVAPDLASLNTFLGVVPRDRNDPLGMTTFHNNLVKPSSHVGLHAQLVEFDVTQHGGVNIGSNSTIQTVAPPFMSNGKLKMSKSITYRWYAGKHSFRPDPSGTGNDVELAATPVEYGGTNLMPADKMKQGQKGLMGALIIEPEGSSWVEDPNTRTSATVTTEDDNTFRDFAVVMQKGQSHRYADGSAVENIEGGLAGIAEDSQDMGQMAINFATEPLWFRFGIGPNAPFGQAGFGAIANAHEAYSNLLAGVGGDPETPVFTAEAGQEVRMRLLMPHGIGRGTTFNLHGHVWQRAPYVCPDENHLGLPGKCDPDPSNWPVVGSKAIGNNPIGMSLGHQESVNGTEHFEIVLQDTLLPDGTSVPGGAGGVDGVTGDYLFRDQASFGNLSGLWGILRVQPAP